MSAQTHRGVSHSRERSPALLTNSLINGLDHTFWSILSSFLCAHALLGAAFMVPLTREFLEVTARKQPIRLMSGCPQHYWVSCRCNSGRSHWCHSSSRSSLQEAVHPWHISWKDPLQRSKCPFRHLAGFPQRPARQICLDFRKAAQENEEWYQGTKIWSYLEKRESERSVSLSPRTNI